MALLVEGSTQPHTHTQPQLPNLFHLISLIIPLDHSMKTDNCMCQPLPPLAATTGGDDSDIDVGSRSRQNIAGPARPPTTKCLSIKRFDIRLASDNSKDFPTRSPPSRPPPCLPASSTPRIPPCRASAASGLTFSR